MMASVPSMYCDDGSDSYLSQDEYLEEESNSSEKFKGSSISASETSSKFNLIHKLFNRQLYGRITKNPRAKTERLFNHIHNKCRYRLDQLISSTDMFTHIFMGFTICGNYFITYKEKLIEDLANLFISLEYDLYIWRFIPGHTLRYISNHRVFKLLKGSEPLDELTFLQYPADPYKLYCYGVEANNPVMAYLTILTLPVEDHCITCNDNNSLYVDEPSITQSWCLKHGFMLHYMFSMTHPHPKFDPNVALAYPDHVVINTGHCIHVLHVAVHKPSLVNNCNPPHNIQNTPFQNAMRLEHYGNIDRDSFSEVSDCASHDNFSTTNSVIDAIIEDFNEYDLEGSEGNRPFHELNISCEPLNLTGKSYHNTLVQNIVDPRLKRLQSSVFSSGGASSITVNQNTRDKVKIAEKAYEFTEETEEKCCEKLSSFRKKRLADKKYEFSEDNSENIVPFNSLRKERRFLYRSAAAAQQQQQRCQIKSPDGFLSPRSPGVRSPMQSPTSRGSSCSGGQFSPRNTIYCPSTVILRHSPQPPPSQLPPSGCSTANLPYRSPHSPRSSDGSRDGSARRFCVYSPVSYFDTGDQWSECTDYSSSKLVLRQINNNQDQQQCRGGLLQQQQQSSIPGGLLIVDAKGGISSSGIVSHLDTAKWIKKLVKRYSSSDFETSSLVSGHSRDDYNIPIEIPLIVQTLSDQQLEVVPEFKAELVTETQLLITQRTFDCEQFVQRRAQRLCSDVQLQFLHCEDYDIKILTVCPINGHIISHAVIKICALRLSEQHARPQVYISTCLFSWNIDSDAFDLIESPSPTAGQHQQLYLYKPHMDMVELQPLNAADLETFALHTAPVWAIKYKPKATKTYLRDYRGDYEVVFDGGVYEQFRSEMSWDVNTNGYLTINDSDSDNDY